LNAGIGESEIADAILGGLVMSRISNRDISGERIKRSWNRKWLGPSNSIASMAVLAPVFPFSSHAKRDLPGVLTDTAFAFERVGRALMSPSGEFHSNKNYAVEGGSTLLCCRFWTREE
jgi:hypothetical protein